MLGYTLRRLGYGAIVILGAFTGGFLLLYILPGSAAAAAAGEGATIAAIEQRKADLGLDRPAIVQYIDALSRALRGDFGVSLLTGRPATETYFDALPHTLALTFTGLAVAVLLGVTFAVAVELAPWPQLREGLLSLPAIVVSLPPFLLGLWLLHIFSFKLHWVPATGTQGAGSLIIAAVAIGLGGAGHIAQLLSANFRRVMSSPYVETLRNWGLSERDVVLRHALKNASLPVLTALGTTVGFMLGGAVITETVFSRSGIGRIVIAAVDGRDIPVVLMAVIISAAIFVVINFLVDILYPIIDKRIVLH
jgi:peptide/nickel transport system permease protein